MHTLHCVNGYICFCYDRQIDRQTGLGSGEKRRDYTRGSEMKQGEMKRRVCARFLISSNEQRVDLTDVDSCFGRWFSALTVRWIS
jgi:hypothetical protein